MSLDPATYPLVTAPAHVMLPAPATIDLHQVPVHEEDWDRWWNHDDQLLGRGAWALSKKVGVAPIGELTYIGPKISYVTGTGLLGIPTTKTTIGPALAHGWNAHTHRELLWRLDRVLLILAKRTGLAGQGGGNLSATSWPTRTTFTDINDQLDSVSEMISKFGHRLETWRAYDQAAQTDAQLWSARDVLDSTYRLIDEDPLPADPYAGFAAGDIMFNKDGNAKTYKCYSAAQLGAMLNQMTKAFNTRMDKIIDKYLTRVPPSPYDNEDGGPVRMFSAPLEAALNIETNNQALPIDLASVIRGQFSVNGGALRGIDEDARNKQVVILGVQKRQARSGYWTRWVWAMVSGLLTDEALQALYDMFNGNSDANLQTVASCTKDGLWKGPSDVFRVSVKNGDYDVNANYSGATLDGVATVGQAVYAERRKGLSPTYIRCGRGTIVSVNANVMFTIRLDDVGGSFDDQTGTYTYRIRAANGSWTRDLLSAMPILSTFKTNVGVSWTTFKRRYMFNSASGDEYSADAWDKDKVVALLKACGRTDPGTNIDSQYWNSTPVTGPTAMTRYPMLDIDDAMLDHLPQLALYPGMPNPPSWYVPDAYEWSPTTKAWIMKSVNSSTTLDNTATETSKKYIPGQYVSASKYVHVTLALDITLGGCEYAKPFSLTVPPMQVLYAIDMKYKDGSSPAPLQYDEVDIRKYLERGTPLPTLGELQSRPGNSGGAISLGPLQDKFSTT